MKARTQKDVVTKLNPLLRGFANYYRGVVSKETFSYKVLREGARGDSQTLPATYHVRSGQKSCYTFVT